MSDEDLRAEIEKLRVENDQLKTKGVRGLSLKVSEKGAVSLYGVRPVPRDSLQRAVDKNPGHEG